MKIDLNKISIGSWITLGHFSIAEIMSQAKFDWLCIDMEHSEKDESSILNLDKSSKKEVMNGNS